MMIKMRLRKWQIIPYPSLTICYRVVSGILLLGILLAYPLSVSAKQNVKDSPKNCRLDAVKEPFGAPGFALPDRSGNQHQLSDYRGKVVIVNFWSTWCIPCRKEMPALERAWQRLQYSNVALLTIAMQDELEAVNLFLEKSPVSFPVLMDSDGKIAREWQVIGIPITFVLDGAGRIVYQTTGIREWDCDSIVEKILDLTKV